MNAADPVIVLRDVELAYGGLRPLRIAGFALAARECAAITGLDAPMAEAIVNLVTGAVIPQRGDVVVSGRRTAEIDQADDWLASLDRIGLVSARAVLLDELTAFQNLAMAFTLSIDDVTRAVDADVRRLADEVGLPAAVLPAAVNTLGALDVARCHLARALASGPAVLVCEHANALAGGDAEVFGALIARVAASRRLPVLALTADERFARAAARRVLALEAASGALRDRAGWRRWVRMGLW